MKTMPASGPQEIDQRRRDIDVRDAVFDAAAGHSRNPNQQWHANLLLVRQEAAEPAVLAEPGAVVRGHDQHVVAAFERVEQLAQQPVALQRLAVVAILRGVPERRAKPRVVGAGEVQVDERVPQVAAGDPVDYRLGLWRVRLLVVPVPRKDDRRAATAWAVLSATLSSRLRDRLDVVDLAPAIHAILKQENREFDAMFWRYDGHYNAFGNRVFGEAVATAILRTDPADAP